MASPQNTCPVDTGRKFNVHKTLRRCPEHLLSVLCTFNLRPVYLVRSDLSSDLLKMDLL